MKKKRNWLNILRLLPKKIQGAKPSELNWEVCAVL